MHILFPLTTFGLIDFFFFLSDFSQTEMNATHAAINKSGFLLESAAGSSTGTKPVSNALIFF